MKKVRGDDQTMTLARPTRESGRTLGEQAYQILKQDIISGELPPGERLGTEALRTRYSLGGSPLREALTRLTSEALVESEAQRGFRVAPMSQQDFSDLCQIRKIIEIEALRQSILNGDDAWEARVVSAHHRLAKVEAQTPERLEEVYDDWEEFNEAFHTALISACPSQWLHRIHKLLVQQAERYRRITFASGRTVHRDVAAEHAAIARAAIDRDVDAACGLSASHIQQTLNVFEQISGKNT